MLVYPLEGIYVQYLSPSHTLLHYERYVAFVFMYLEKSGKMHLKKHKLSYAYEDLEYVYA